MIKELDLKELKDIYDNYMVCDFPEDELKPYFLIEKFIKDNRSLAIGFYDSSILKGYAIIVVVDKKVVLDYFAILKEYRNNGLGKKFLKELFDYLKDFDFILIEAESPKDELAIKRINFYLGVGCLNSEIKVKAYFVEYTLLYKELAKSFNSENFKKEIDTIYRNIYSDKYGSEYLKFLN